jgi:hypothetical protein
MCVLCESVICLFSFSSGVAFAIVANDCCVVLAMSTNTREFFFVEFCPAMNDCREQLHKHLTNSSKHTGMLPVDRDLLVAGVDVCTDVHLFQEKEQQPKRFKGDSHAGGHDSGSGSSGSHHLAIGASSRQYPGEQITEFQTAQQAQDQDAHVGHVVLRQVEFDSIIDSVARASTCARSAQRLAASAAKAFNDEVAALDMVKAHLELIRSNAELDITI